MNLKGLDGVFVGAQAERGNDLVRRNAGTRSPKGRRGSRARANTLGLPHFPSGSPVIVPRDPGSESLPEPDEGRLVHPCSRTPLPRFQRASSSVLRLRKRSKKLMQNRIAGRLETGYDTMDAEGLSAKQCLSCKPLDERKPPISYGNRGQREGRNTAQ